MGGAILDPTVVDGSFIGPSGLKGFNGHPEPRKEYKPKMSLNPILKQKLWDFCNKSTRANWEI